MSKKTFEAPKEEMTVSLDLDELGTVECEVLTIISIDDKDYIVLLYKPEGASDDESEIWFYGYKENPNDPNEEPELIYIDNDDEYEMVADAFDEYLDEIEYDELDW